MLHNWQTSVSQTSLLRGAFSARVPLLLASTASRPSHSSGMALTAMAQPIASGSKAVLASPILTRRLFSTSRYLRDEESAPKPAVVPTRKGGLAEWVEEQRKRAPTTEPLSSRSQCLIGMRRRSLSAVRLQLGEATVSATACEDRPFGRARWARDDPASWVAVLTVSSSSPQPIRPVDLKPANTIFPFDRERPQRAIVRLGPTTSETWVLDPFRRYGLNPLCEPHNIHLLTPYLSNQGKILSRIWSGLTKKNQRRLTKAIKRARNMGLLPLFGGTEGTDSPVTVARRTAGAGGPSWLR